MLQTEDIQGLRARLPDILGAIRAGTSQVVVDRYGELEVDP
ncbi:MAG: hypothetical protein ACLGIJ_12080 [Candidatus Limnocylindria bacterium]